MSENGQVIDDDRWDATIYTGLFCLVQCARIRELYSQSVDLGELDAREKSLVQAIEFAMEMLAIPGVLDEFRQNLRGESGQLNYLWLESYGLMFAARHPKVAEQIAEDRLPKIEADESTLEINAALGEWRERANPPVPEQFTYIALMSRDECRMPDGAEWRTPQRLIGLLVKYWGLLLQVVNVARDAMMGYSPHPLTQMLVNLRLRMDEIVELLPESNEVSQISEAFDFFWGPLFQENGCEFDDFQAVPEAVMRHVQVVTNQVERLRMKWRGKIPPITTFAEDYFIRAAEVGIVSYREDITRQNKRFNTWAEELRETRKEKPGSQSSSDVPRQVDPCAPQWDSENRILRFGSQVARRVDAKARRLITILSAFEDEHWAARIDDPLPGGRDPERLRDALGTLNKDLKFIRFEADGTGEGIRWTVIEAREISPPG